MKKQTKLLLVVVMLAILATILIFPLGCTNSGKKAIIILPGIMGSNIVDATTGDPLWAPLENSAGNIELNASAFTKLMNRKEVKDLLDVDGPKGAFEWLRKMRVNPDGTTNVACEPQQILDNGCVKFDKSYYFGTVNYYEKFYNFMWDNFSDEYDVRLFEYDWRLDNSVSAKKLEQFIKDHKYKEVVLIGHSMGGVLASTFIASSDANAKKVSKFISLGTPYFGAHKAMRVLNDPMSMLGDFSSLLDKVKPILNNMNKDYEGDAFQDLFDGFMSFVNDLPTLYQLLPYEDMVGAYSDNNPDLNGHGIITIDGEPVNDYTKYIEFFDNFTSNKRCVNNMVKWQQEQYRNGKHATEYVDTTFFVGNGLETESGSSFVSDGNGGYKMQASVNSSWGDGTVALYSASCGHPLTDPRLVEMKGVSHGDLVSNDATLDKIAQIIKSLN